MKVKDLAELLSKVDPELDVIMSSDPEGNSHSPLYNWGIVNYFEEGFNRGTVFDLDDEEANEDYANELRKVLCLWPA